MDEESKIQAIREYAEDHPKFDTDFLDSVEAALAKYGRLTESQSRALDNIIEGYRIEI